MDASLPPSSRRLAITDADISSFDWVDDERLIFNVLDLQAGIGELDSVIPLWLNTRTGNTRSFDSLGRPANAVQWWFTPQGEPRLVLTRDRSRLAYHWFTPDGRGSGRWKQIAEGTLLNPPPAPAWVGAEDLYLEQPMGSAGETYVVPFDFTKGAPGEKPLVRAPGFDFDGSFISSREGKLLGLRINTDAEDTIWFDPGRKALQAVVDNAFPGRVNRVACRRCDADDAVVLVRTFTDRDPGQLLLRTKANGSWRRLSLVMPGIDPAQMARTDLQRIQARDGRDLPVWITGQKKTADGKPLAQPAIVMVHGGPWIRTGYWRWEPMRQFLASRGYLVIEPEFRGSEGYGAAHLKAGFKQWGQAMQDDVADALLWAQKSGWATGKACIAGASYGGYSTLMGLIKQPDLYRCGAAWVAVTDPFLLIEGSWWVRDDISDSGRRYSLKDKVGDPKTDEAMLKANSPVEQAALIKAPLLLAFGEEDLRVPLAHGKRLRSALEKAGRPPAVWVTYSGEGHGWRKTENQVDFAKRLESFFAQHLKP